MKIGPKDSKIVSIISAINVLKNHKFDIVRDNGWGLDEYDDMLKNSGRMIGRVDFERLVDRYVKILNDKLTTHHEVDIFKIIYLILEDMKKI